MSPLRCTHATLDLSVFYARGFPVYSPHEQLVQGGEDILFRPQGVWHRNQRCRVASNPNKASWLSSRPILCAAWNVPAPLPPILGPAQHPGLSQTSAQALPPRQRFPGFSQINFVWIFPPMILEPFVLVLPWESLSQHFVIVCIQVFLKDQEPFENRDYISFSCGSLSPSSVWALTRNTGQGKREIESFLNRYYMPGIEMSAYYFSFLIPTLQRKDFDRFSSYCWTKYLGCRIWIQL